MPKKYHPALLCLALLLGATAAPLRAEPHPISPWFSNYYAHHKMQLPVIYKTVGGHALKLELFERQATSPTPVLVYIHGGAWGHGTASWEIGHILPWMEMGFSVVSVEYRMSGEARAPAAAEDCTAALHWIARHAAEHQFDLHRLVLAGASAGAHLALLVGMAPPSAGFDLEMGEPTPRPAAIVSLSGIADVVPLLSGPNRRQFAVDWIGSSTNTALAKRVSPNSYVRPGLPPIMLVHGDADPTVPYEDAVRLHAALDRAGVDNELLTIPGGKHGGWRPEDYFNTYAAIGKFIDRHHLTP